MSTKIYKIAATTLILLLLCVPAAYAFSPNCYCTLVNGGSFVNAYAVSSADVVCTQIRADGSFYVDGVLADTASGNRVGDTWAQANMSANNPSGSQQFYAFGYHYIVYNGVAYTYNSSKLQSY
ncbi:hypothetical protein REC12_20055 [Desulfosporosinus sp. PR]|uniref:hypothetical protein n=1 Tax=Candidatus Desulfosporosinus nitrosoreducens TaxID=3401928 RepID=UPI0027F8E1D9|nr:hypothetical protein [Desulfosporosinus sp. PR]MDQ7095892.1 hypothetical protein [Desulfosporosinus sp. PR]